MSRCRRLDRLSRVVLAVLVFLEGAVAVAETDRAAREFHQLFRSTLPVGKFEPENLARLHMLPDKILMAATEASSVADASKLASNTSLEALITHTLLAQAGPSFDADAVLKKQPITLVIVPGIFGEFIKTRAFEEVFAKSSSSQTEFVRIVKRAASNHHPAATDDRYSMPKMKNESVPLSKVINVGHIKDWNGQVVIKVVLLYTSFMSLESLTNAPTQAEIFNRRLSKYLELTGAQDLAFVGYSRGTIIALEMLAQLNATQTPWLSSVKGLVSLGGVVWGSTLADQFTRKEAAIGKLLQYGRELRNDVDPNSRWRTYGAWSAFGFKVKDLLPQLQEKPNAPKSQDLINPQIPTSLDRRSLTTLFFLAVKHLGLKRFIDGHADNVRRFQTLFDAALEGLNSLKSSSREKWWATHELPKHVTYYSLTAAMANPDASAFEKSVFDGSLGYGQRSYDDLWLLQNRLDYEGFTKISLNDSQVAVPQAMFLPNAIAKLSPKNTGLKTQMLGILGTHHWGLALPVVNVMNDKRTNPFPREALLKAIAAKVVLDQ